MLVEVTEAEFVIVAPFDRAWNRPEPPAKSSRTHSAARLAIVAETVPVPPAAGVVAVQPLAA